jgi:ribosome maturation factor RimP
VSSPGLDRPVRTLEEFSRFKGQLAKVKLVGLIEGRKRFTARIASVMPDGSIEFSEVQDGPAGATIRVALDQIDKARLEPEL